MNEAGEAEPRLTRDFVGRVIIGRVLRQFSALGRKARVGSGFCSTEDELSAAHENRFSAAIRLSRVGVKRATLIVGGATADGQVGSLETHHSPARPIRSAPGLSRACRRWC